MRDLVTIRTINELRPIVNADAIECAAIDGWEVVVKKGEFKQGDQCVYFEIDSLLPLSDERFSFLAKSGVKEIDGKQYARLHTIKLRGQVSQGLALPLSMFGELPPPHDQAARPEAFSKENGIIAEWLHVLKYEPPIPAELAGEVLGPFPEFIPKTDQERIQNRPELLTSAIERLDKQWEVTEKLDGSSMTVFSHNPKDGSVVRLGVCSRNWELKESESNTLWRVAYEIGIIGALTKLMWNYGRSVAVQGELIGPGIQGNPYKLKRHQWHIFDVYDIDEQRYLTPAQRVDVINKLVNYGATLDRVPFVTLATLSNFHDMTTLLNIANGKSMLNPAVDREGLVFKRNDASASFKVISNAYLLKTGT